MHCWPERKVGFIGFNSNLSVSHGNRDGQPLKAIQNTCKYTSQRDRDLLIFLTKAKKGLITQCQVAEETGQTERHIRRIPVKLKREGDQAVVHGRRGQRSNRKLDEKSRAKAVAILGQEEYRGFGPTLASE